MSECMAASVLSREYSTPGSRAERSTKPHPDRGLALTVTFRSVDHRASRITCRFASNSCFVTSPASSSSLSCSMRSRTVKPGPLPAAAAGGSGAVAPIGLEDARGDEAPFFLVLDPRGEEARREEAGESARELATGGVGANRFFSERASFTRLANGLAGGAGGRPRCSAVSSSTAASVLAAPA
ncbi:hypothetical protein Ctob_004229 [Chrysochromulina tobinii]|uniref:Uncharacterized protein n=1 Tax=Chrysochromulina tobinii TaxID=1460289 RepID=A0A0M0JLP1_9EUKA|nr:hypothetical protein Ctob_004229 [Chrysochromulina tobinii]|eukprot:KOO27474.1 hypothetical protein Ctob_004229 [Chrysochromulina sp. CCMP291]